MTTPPALPARAAMPDYLRLIALFGIVVVNVQYIAFSAVSDFVEPTGESTLDALTLWLVHGLALLKTYGLFSFMFGVGLGLLMRSAERRGLAFGWIYRNRILGLLALGLLHGCLFFPGDILTIYAITGALLFLVRNGSVRRLTWLGVSLLALQVIITPPLILAAPETPADIVALERSILTQGGFLEAVAFRSVGFAVILPSFLILQGVSAFGWFCLGLAALKSGMIDQASHPLWQAARRWCLVPGVVASLISAGIWQWSAPAIGATVTVVVAPITTLGYLGLIAALSQNPGPIMRRLLTAGGASLSIYLGQSIILSTLFSNYGLGLWGAVDRIEAVLIAVATTVVLVWMLALWRTRFALGPFEWVLRRFTYAGVTR